MTDAEAIEATKQGEREAFAVLVARYQRMVEGVAYTVTGEHALVDDIVQDTFVTAWRTVDSLRDPERVRAWLGGIARNVAYNARRRRNTRRESQLLVDVGGDHTAFDQVAEQEIAREIAAALARLPQRYREPLVLFYYEHCTVREVADTLALREDAVMQRLTRGRRRLGEDLATRVEVELEKKPSRAAIAAALLLLLPARAATAAPAAAAASKLPLLLAHWRIPAAALAVGVASVVLGLGVQRSNAIAARAEDRAPREVAKPSAPEAPKLPPDVQSDRVLSTISLADLDPVYGCKRGIRSLVISLLARPNFKTFEDRINWRPAADIMRIANEIADRASPQCEGPRWPEIYLICEGTAAEILDAEVSCYPYDPFHS